MKPAHLRLLSKLNRKRQLEEQEAVRTAPPPPPPRVAGPELGREINVYFHSTGGAAVGKFYRGTPVSIDETTGEYRVEYVDGAVEMHNFRPVPRFGIPTSSSRRWSTTALPPVRCCSCRSAGTRARCGPRRRRA